MFMKGRRTSTVADIEKFGKPQQFGNWSRLDNDEEEIPTITLSGLVKIVKTFTIVFVVCLYK